MDQTLKLSLILPCYNEATRIEATVQDIVDCFSTDFGADFSYELILVNDGSRDNTKEVIVSLEKKYPQVRAISYDQNGGKGHAIKLGVAAAQGTIIGYMDSDGEIEPRYAIKYYKHLTEHPAVGVVIGSKSLSESNMKRSLKRRLLSGVSQYINAILFSLPIRDTQVGIKLFRAEIGKAIFPILTIEGYAFDVEFLFHANARGSLIRELPIELDILHKKTTVDTYAMFRILADLFILFKRVNYIYILRKQELRMKTRVRIFLLRLVIFPSERVLSFFLQKFKNPKKKVAEVSV